MKDNKTSFNVLDGSSEEQSKTVESFLNSLTYEEHKKAMSNEFDYLEED